jgi:hypothetical protein
MSDTPDTPLREAYLARLYELRLEHRDLDLAIHRMQSTSMHDQLAVKRMKKRKLLLKDQIAWIERQIDPDVPA